MAAPSSSSGSTYATHAHRRASSVPNLRERPSGSPQMIVPHSPWNDEAFSSASPSALPQRPPPLLPALETQPTAQMPSPAPPTPAPRARRRGGSGWRFRWRRATRFFGYGRGNEARKELVTLVFTLCWGTFQIGSIVFLLTAAALATSKTDPTKNEWQACEKPLPAWAIIWCIRVLVGFVTTTWAWRISKYRNRTRDPENGNSGMTNAAAVQPSLHDTAPSEAPAQPQGAALSSTTSSQRSKTLNRLTTLTSLFSLAWFIVAHSFLYTSITTCKVSSPHLWWIVFGIVCIGYLIVAEVLLVGIVVFVLVPLIFLVINVVLVCLGRRPLLPGNDIHPEIPRLSQRLVDKIPLVLYIPPPPESADKGPTVPAPAHTYPPNSRSNSRLSSSSRRPLFKFLNRRRKSTANGKKKDLETAADEKAGVADVWEDKWEKGEYPFVRLDENRAACAICLMDFEPPKKIHPSVHEASSVEPADIPELVLSDSPVADEEDGDLDADVDGEDNANLRLQDAGDGVQPLRLLSCGHVFHKTCLDPWLVDVSGRCPTCQQRVEVPEQETGPSRGSGRRRRG